MTNPYASYRLDCRPSVPDHHDRVFSSTVGPERVADVINIDMGTPYDQGQEGSCTGNAQAKLHWAISRLQGLVPVQVSRAMIYYLSRMIEGTQNSDSGSTIADSVAALVKYGACPETEFPYVPGDFARAPTAQQLQDALPFRATQYEAVPLTPDMIGLALAAGHPVSIGFSVYDSFFGTGPDGMVPDPAGSLRGGHDVLICGQRRSSGLYRFVNSWGQGWGQDGYGYMKANYLFSNLVFEARTIDAVLGPTPTPPAPPAPPVDDAIDGLGFHFKSGLDVRIGAGDLAKVLKQWGGQ